MTLMGICVIRVICGFLSACLQRHSFSYLICSAFHDSIAWL